MSYRQRNIPPLIPFISTVILVVLLVMGCRSSNSIRVADNPVSEADSLTSADTTKIAETSKKPSRADSIRQALIEEQKEEIYKEYQAKANGVTTHYIRAQQYFYNGDYEEALYYINKAAGFKENADVLALRGSIYLGLGSIEEFVTNWRRALEMDEDLPLSYNNVILRELQNQGLLDDNYRKNF